MNSKVSKVILLFAFATQILAQESDILRLSRSFNENRAEFKAKRRSELSKWPSPKTYDRIDHWLKSMIDLNLVDGESDPKAMIDLVEKFYSDHKSKMWKADELAWSMVISLKKTSAHLCNEEEYEILDKNTWSANIKDNRGAIGPGSRPIEILVKSYLIEHARACEDYYTRVFDSQYYDFGIDEMKVVDDLTRQIIHSLRGKEAVITVFTPRMAKKARAAIRYAPIAPILDGVVGTIEINGRVFGTSLGLLRNLSPIEKATKLVSKLYNICYDLFSRFDSLFKVAAFDAETANSWNIRYGSTRLMLGWSSLCVCKSLLFRDAQMLVDAVSSKFQ